MFVSKLGVCFTCGILCFVQWVVAGPVTEEVVDLGQDVSIPCGSSSEHQPPAADTWRLNSKPLDLAVARYIVSEDATLQITAVRYEDEGRYQCHLEGSEESQNVTLLRVRGPPSLVDAPLEVTVLKDESFNLSCPARGWPKPNVTWDLGEGTQVPATYQGGHTLRLSGVRKNTNFTCVARNPLGSVEHTIQVVTKEETVNVAVVVILVLLAALVLVVALVPLCRSKFKKTMNVA